MSSEEAPGTSSAVATHSAVAAANVGRELDQKAKGPDWPQADTDTPPAKR